MPEGLIRSLSRGVFHAFSHISHHSTASGPHNQNKGWCTTKTEYVVNRSGAAFAKKMHWPLLRLTISEIVLSWRRRGLGSMMFHDDVMTTMISDSFRVELWTAYCILYKFAFLINPLMAQSPRTCLLVVPQLPEFYSQSSGSQPFQRFVVVSWICIIILYIWIIRLTYMHCTYTR